MHTTRRTVLRGMAATGAAASLPAPAVLAQAAEELKLATFVPPSHIIMAKVLSPWAEQVDKASGGKLKIRFFPSMQLGGKPPELYRQTIQGISDICFTLPGYTSGDFPMMALTELPGAANSGTDGTKKLWSYMDKFLGREYKGAKVLMLWNSDSAALMSRAKPIKSLADMKGMKIRTPSAAQSAQLEVLGATPIDMPANQIYNNLERGVIDASMIPMSAAIDFKLIEVAKHFTLNAPLGRSNFLVAMNQARYDKLPAELKKVIDATTGLGLSLKGAETYDVQNDLGAAAAKKDREVIMLPADEVKRWQAAFAPLIKAKADEGDKAGLPASALVKAMGLMS